MISAACGRLGVAEVFIDITENEFPFASGIGRHDDAVTSGEHIVDDLGSCLAAAMSVT